MKGISAKLANVLGGYDFICGNCGCDVFDSQPFCTSCNALLPLNNGKTCKKCGTAIYGEESYCSKCGKREVFFDKAYSVYLFEGIVRTAIHRIKYGNDVRLVYSFARQMVDYFVKIAEEFDAVTYVPAYAQGSTRGYNQSYLLAEAFCDILQVEPPLELLTKVAQTLPQEGLNYVERLQNLKSAIKCTQEVNCTNVLLIDDVLTTGATASSCAKQLKSKGAKRVVVLTLASRREIFLTETM